MRVKFRDEALFELYDIGSTKNRKYKQICKNKMLIEGYKRAVSIMFEAGSTNDLKKVSFLHYEKLKYQHGVVKGSVRLVNGMIERLIFYETDNGIEIELIEIDSSHYGNKK